MKNADKYAPSLLLTGAALMIGHALYVQWFVVPPRPMTEHALYWYALRDTWPVVAVGAGCLIIGLILFDK